MFEPDIATRDDDAHGLNDYGFNDYAGPFPGSLPDNFPGSGELLAEIGLPAQTIRAVLGSRGFPGEAGASRWGE